LESSAGADCKLEFDLLQNLLAKLIERFKDSNLTIVPLALQACKLLAEYIEEEVVVDRSSVVLLVDGLAASATHSKKNIVALTGEVLKTWVQRIEFCAVIWDKFGTHRKNASARTLLVHGLFASLQNFSELMVKLPSILMPLLECLVDKSAECRKGAGRVLDLIPLSSRCGGRFARFQRTRQAFHYGHFEAKGNAL
jgi:hypothetical protein